MSARRIEASARCARCGHVKTGLSMYEMLMEPGPCPTPGCSPVRVQATVGRPVLELKSSDTGEGPQGQGCVEAGAEPAPGTLYPERLGSTPSHAHDEL